MYVRLWVMFVGTDEFEAILPAFSWCDPRERTILRERLFNPIPPTQYVLAKRLGITGERVRQLERRIVRRAAERWSDDGVLAIYDAMLKGPSEWGANVEHLYAHALAAARGSPPPSGRS